MLVDCYPLLSETFVRSETAALARAGHRVRIEAERRPPGPPQLPAPEGVEVVERGRATRLERLGALLWLAAHNPRGCLADLRRRRRWRAEEWPAPLRALAPVALRTKRAGDTHLHAHFAGAAALDAQRLGALLGMTHSVTAHAYDIYSEPRNLQEKLRRADLVTTGCDYNVRHLRSLMPPSSREHIRRVVMGVDGSYFRRSGPLPNGRRVIAVGRLVEKKGFAQLVHAAALARPEHVTIVGEGPERAALERLIAELGVGELVELVGARPPHEVRELLEASDVLAMPSIVAADGDRDSMPVVVKEAMAMELLVVASDEVGLPEIVREPWGRLVPAGDARALAGALEELLALAPPARAAAGAAGRAFALENADVDREARRLSEMIAALGPATAPGQAQAPRYTRKPPPSKTGR